MAISSIGVGSGLPLDTLLENLRKSENGALTLIDTRAKAVQSRLSGYGTIKSAIEAFKAAADALGKAETFGAMTAKAGGSAFTATATSAAIAGEYMIDVQALATRQTLTGTGQASRTSTLAAGDVTLTVTLANGSSKAVTVSQANSSLEGIVKAINEQSGLGVNATLVNDGSANPHRLLLTSQATGTDAAVQSITVAAADGASDVSGVNALFGFDKGGAPNPNLAETAATNASVVVNGISVTNQSNTIDGAIEGVTLTLAQTTTAGKPESLSITANDSVTSGAIKTFVDTYNSLQGIIKSLTTYNVDNQTASALTGDSLARSVQSELRGALNTAQNSGAFATLAQIGITTDPKEGKLVIDNTKLDAALKANMVDVRKLFSDTGGIATKASAVSDRYTKSGGTISLASDSMTATLKDLEKQYQATSDRIDVKMESMRKQFIQLDSTLAQMNSISSYLTQQLANLSSSSSNKK
ncbi:flagellar filament capping protein FliD [Pusillimonas sp. TS35]|uniref:flagellar filament capping protein FliD n=1 Tax=Paracandidimonas lactea TaxID=2895524 RepID=UPI0013694597|nr:flagellar filament capping protein FliD [Paracandidimonas lactea]MYN11665.1 flagellar filament capping protein FliD [Pusillimonas sp. TS35]